MNYNEIEDIKLKREEIRKEISEKKEMRKIIIKEKENMEINICKQNILNKIAREKINGISQYYYNRLEELKVDFESIEIKIKELGRRENELNNLVRINKAGARDQDRAKEVQVVKMPTLSRKTTGSKRIRNYY